MKRGWVVGLFLTLLVSSAFAQGEANKAQNLRNCLGGFESRDYSQLTNPQRDFPAAARPERLGMPDGVRSMRPFGAHTRRGEASSRCRTSAKSLGLRNDHWIMR